MKFILGRKLKMSQIFEGEKVIPVTLVEAGPCWVTQKKDKEKDGYQAIQLGFQKKGNKYRYQKEFRVDPQEYKLDQEIKVDLFSVGEKVKVRSLSKGKGFQGVVKRWGFSGQNATHGGKGDVRKLGSIGSSFPERVVRGRKMPGRMGHNQVTVQNLKIAAIDQENNLLAVKGAIPGSRGSLIKIQSQ
jgi:large subunit ribosomal protein L3